MKTTYIVGALAIVAVIFILSLRFNAPGEPVETAGPVEETPATAETDRAELGGADSDTPPASAASELATDVATDVARDGEPGAAIESRETAIAAAEAEGTVGALEFLSVEGYDPVLVEDYIAEADLLPEEQDSYMERLGAAENDTALEEVLADLRSETGIAAN